MTSIIIYSPFHRGRLARPAISKAIRQGLVDLERLAVDPHGYTDVAMAVARLLGRDLCPRLADLRKRTLLLPQGVRVPPSVAPIGQSLSLTPLVHAWDGLVRVAASIRRAGAPAYWRWTALAPRRGATPFTQPARRWATSFERCLSAPTSPRSPFVGPSTMR